MSSFVFELKDFMRSLFLNNASFTPSKIVCVGRNYLEHIEELGNEIPEEMVIFLKPNSAIANELASLQDEPLHFEGEICFRYAQGRFDAIAFGLDLTKRGLQTKLKNKGLPWERAKAFNGAAVFSEFVVLDTNADALHMELLIDSELQQHGKVDQMIYKPHVILSELQKFMTLEDGDVVMTGTPKGVGVVQVGREYHGKIFNSGKVIVEANWRAN